MQTTCSFPSNRDRNRPRIHKTASAFTLLELLVVISIMVVLAALVVAASIGIREGARRHMARTQLSAIELALGSYRGTNGEFPTSEANPETDPEAGAAVLYQALVGDGSDLLNPQGPSSPSNGQLDPSEKSHLPDLAPKTNLRHMIKQVESGAYILVDPWGEPWRYLHHKDDPPGNRRANQRRPVSYDLYSHAHSAEEHAKGIENEAKWLVAGN